MEAVGPVQTLSQTTISSEIFSPRNSCFSLPNLYRTPQLLIKLFYSIFLWLPSLAVLYLVGMQWKPHDYPTHWYLRLRLASSFRPRWHFQALAFLSSCTLSCFPYLRSTWTSSHSVPRYLREYYPTGLLPELNVQSIRVCSSLEDSLPKRSSSEKFLGSHRSSARILSLNFDEDVTSLEDERQTLRLFFGICSEFFIIIEQLTRTILYRTRRIASTSIQIHRHFYRDFWYVAMTSFGRVYLAPSNPWYPISSCEGMFPLPSQFLTSSHSLPTESWIRVFLRMESCPFVGVSWWPSWHL